MVGYAVDTPHSIEYSGAVLFPVHVDPLNFHRSGGSKRRIFPTTLATSLSHLPSVATVVLVVVSVEYPVVFVRLDITKRGYAWTHVIGK